MPLPTWHPIRLQARLGRWLLAWSTRAEAQALHHRPLRTRHY